MKLIQKIQLKNPVIPIKEGTLVNGEMISPLASLIARLWKTIVIVGGLLLLIYLIMGALYWITAGGDKEKIKEAQQRITNGIVGLAILTASFAIMAFMKNVFGFDLLNIVWPTPGN